jgi:serine/threonine protein phosphatase 1
MAPIYAVGDIHGQLDHLELALARIEADGGPDAEIVFLGDLVDRGPDCCGVIELLDQGLKAGRNWTVIKGNHDRMFEWFMEDEPRQDPHMLIGHHWFHERIGGTQTLASYGVDIPEGTRLYQLHERANEAVPQAHVDFLRAQKLYHIVDDKLFVHAGIRPGVALEDQIEMDLVWIREPFLSHAEPFPWLVVHGHTALDYPKHHGNRVNLDGGAGYGRPIYPAVIEGRDVWLLTENGREPLLSEA